LNPTKISTRNHITLLANPACCCGCWFTDVTFPSEGWSYFDLTGLEAPPVLVRL
jgi:hypothetical protein